MTYAAPDLSEHRLKIAGFDVTLRMVDDASSNSDQRWGAFHCLPGRIEYQSTWPCGAKFIDTLLHEIGHAIFWAYGIYDDDKEERTVATMATAMVQIYRDNMWLLSLIENVLDEQNGAST